MKQLLLLLLCSTCILSCGITYKIISEDSSGHIIDSEYTGKGKYISKIYNGRRPLSYMTCGDTYIGEWKNGKFYGKGKMTYPNGTIKEGLWENGEFIG